MSNTSNTPEPCPAQDAPRRYWKEAFDGLDGEIKKRVTKLKKTFDNDTERALKKLAGRKSSAETVEQLQELAQIYQRLSMKRKGDILRLDMTSKRHLDDNTVASISDILYEARHSSGNNESEELDELLELCQERQKLSKVKNWEFEFLGKSYSVHDLWIKVISKLDALKAPIDLATQADPTAGLVWSVVKVFLEFAILVEDVAGSILTGIEKALGAIQRGSIYERQIQAIQLDPKRVHHSHIQTFESTLISVYTRIFRFFSTAAAALEKNKVSYWRAFWDHDDIVEFETDTLKDEEALHHNSSLSTMITQNAMLADVTRMVSDLNNQLSKNEKLKERRHLNRSREATLRWLSNLPVRDHHIEAHERWTKDTGDWIFRRDEYTQLIEEDGAGLLWIKGIPGAGKTVLISHVIDHYLQQTSGVIENDKHENDEVTPIGVDNESDAAEKLQLAYFYCKRDVAERRASESIFRSFIKQLAIKYHPIPESIHQLYEEINKPSSLTRKVYPEQYRKILKGLIPKTTDTILILDALDECMWDAGQPTDEEDSKKDMTVVLETLGYLLNSGLPVKIIVTSRYDETIETSLSDKYRIEISPEDNWDDISAMIKSRVKEYRKRKKALSITKELRKSIMSVFKKKSRGMFQWASLHISYLLTLPSPSAIEEELGHLPLGLKMAYDGFFGRVRLQTEFKTNMALRVFRWLLACQGSLDKKVLLAAISQTLKQSKANEVYGDIRIVLAVCQNLVVAEGDLLRFSHLSVQEYCEKHQSDLTEDCHLEVVKVCAWTLFNHDNHNLAHRYWIKYHDIRGMSRHPTAVHLAAVPVGDSELYSLWQFAYDVYYDHLQEITSIDQRKEIAELLKCWIRKDSPHPVFANWIFLKAADMMLMAFNFRGDIIYSESLVNWIGQIRHQQGMVEFAHAKLTTGSLIVLESILAGVCWNARDNFERHLLGYCLPEHSKGEGPDRYIRLEDRESVLKFGLTGDPRSHIVDSEIKRLWIMLSDCNSQHFDYTKRLVQFKPIFEEKKWSTHECYEELAGLILLLLCVQGAYYPTSEEAEFANLLFQHFPRLSKHEKINYQWLIPPIGYLDLSTSLLIAARRPETSFIQILINHGAQINAPKNSWRVGGTPLINAIYYGRLENTKLLLDRGADVNMEARASYYGTPLIAACAEDNIKILSLLLNHPQISINQVSSTGVYGTALIAACANRRIANIRLLLKKNAHINATTKNGIYSTAMFAAADMTCLRIVRLLVRGGARSTPEASGMSWKLDGSRKPIPELDGVQELSWRLAQRLILDSVRDGADDGIGQNDQDVDDGDAVITSEDESDDSDEDDSDEVDSDQGIKSALGDITAQGPSSRDDAIRYDGVQNISTVDMTGILRQLNGAMSISYAGTAKIVADALGFEDHMNTGALWKGMEKLLKATYQKNWDLVKDSWISFIDLAEDCDCETKGPGDEDVERLANGGLLPPSSDAPPSFNLLRQESGFDYSPYETELDI